MKAAQASAFLSGNGQDIYCGKLRAGVIRVSINLAQKRRDQADEFDGPVIIGHRGWKQCTTLVLRNIKH